jgi:ABC-2 type transport system ATP-binding protein
LGLDIEITNNVREWLKEIVEKDEKTILITSHDMRFIESVCDRVLVISKGKIMALDSVDNLIDKLSKKVYAIKTKGRLTDKQQNELCEIGGFENETINGDDTILLALHDTMSVYDMVDIFKRGKTIIESIEVKRTDLENIFLKIVNHGEN